MDMRPEDRDWYALSFISRNEDHPHGVWSPARADASKDKPRAWIADHMIGYGYAADLIDHFHEYRNVIDVGERLEEICDDIFRSGNYGPVEWAFFRALGSYLARGRFQFVGYTSVVLDDRQYEREWGDDAGDGAEPEAEPAEVQP